MSDLMTLAQIAKKLGKSESRLRVVKTWEGFPAPKRDWYAVGQGRIPALFSFTEVKEFYLANTGKRVGRPRAFKYGAYFKN